MSDNSSGKGRDKLGFGYMRLPQVNGVFDYDSVNAMVDRFIELGFTYFDSANAYLGSELALGKSLVKRHPRDSYWLSSKMNILGFTKPEQMQEMFDTALSRLGTNYLDAYFIHVFGPDIVPLADSLDTWGFLRGLKERGLVKYIGTAWHGPPDKLDEVLTAHPELDIILSMINYLDWVNPESSAKECYEVIKKHGKLVSVIEPCKGGLLAGEESEAAKLLKTANPDVSTASWAFRFVLGFDNIKSVLSGMGTMEQLEDNAKTFNNYTPLTDEELSILDKAVRLIKAKPRIQCTSCRACVPLCPKKIPIPYYINVYSDYLVHQEKEGPGYQIGLLKTHGSTQPVDCVKCHACEGHCPQRLPISDILETMDRELGEVSRKYVIIDN